MSITTPIDPVLAVAERQLRMLSELAAMTMELSRAHAAADLAATHAVEVILADEYWQPETGRARALAGSKDAAEAFQKVSRSLRLTLAMEMSMSETVRDLRAGIIAHSSVCSKDAGETPALRLNQLDPVSPPERRRPAGSCSDCEPQNLDHRESESLVEFDRPDRVPRGTFREVVDHLCAEIGIVPDWENYGVGRPPFRYEPLAPRPPGWSECRPPGSTPACDPLAPGDREAALPP